jgi:hypothetical protein
MEQSLSKESLALRRRRRSFSSIQFFFETLFIG